MRWDQLPKPVSSGGGGGGVATEDEGTPVDATATTLNFVGAGVTATGGAGTTTVTIPGGGGSAPMRATWLNSGLAIVAADANIIYVYATQAGTIAGVSLLTIGGTGSCVVDIRLGLYSAYPVVASICASAKPTISGGFKYLDTTLTGWTTSVAVGDVIAFVLESSSTFTAIFAQLDIQ